jgi:hypothetical protein
LVEDGAGVGADGGVSGDGVFADADEHGPQGAQGLDELLDGDAGGVLQVAGDGQGGEHDGQVGLDRVTLMVEHGSCRRFVTLLCPESSGEGLELAEDLAGDVSLEAASDLASCLALGGAAFDVGAGCGVVGHADSGDDVQGKSTRASDFADPLTLYWPDDL